jgi:hypothetical protein
MCRIWCICATVVVCYAIALLGWATVELSEMSDNESETIQGRGTRSNSKVFVHVPPRVDQEYYQVEIPYVYHGPAPPQAALKNWWNGTHEIHSIKHEEIQKSMQSYSTFE